MYSRTLLVVLLALAGLGVAIPAVSGPRGGTGAKPATLAQAEPKPVDYFTDEHIRRADRYSGTRLALGVASILLGLAVAAVLGLGEPGRALARWATRTTGDRWPLTVLLLGTALTLIPGLVTLPLSIWRGLYVERAYGLSTQSLGGWLSDFAKGNLVAIVVTGIGALGFFFLARKLPAAWPFAAGAFLVALTIGMVVLYPLVYEPLFNRFHPVDPARQARIVALADRAGVDVDEVLVADASRRTTKQNAYVSGLGGTKRVVLYDTLLEQSTPEQVDLVVAHELGHVVHRDVWRGTLLASAGAAGAVALAWLLSTRPAIRELTQATGAGDPRMFPFLAFVLTAATLLTLPIANAYSRSIEASADRFAVRLTGDAATAVQTEVSLATSNLSDVTPNPVTVVWFFSHPPVMDRIAIALEEGAKARR